MSGRLSFTGGAQPGVQNLLVSIEHRDGYRQQDIATDASGSYSFTHTLRYGLTRFNVTYNGDAQHEAADAYSFIHRPAKPWDLDMDGDADLAVGAPAKTSAQHRTQGQ